MIVVFCQWLSFNLGKLSWFEVVIYIHIIWVIKLLNINECPTNLIVYVLGKISVQNDLNATRIFVNPSIPEIDAFNQGYE
jgi:hypothetical protein